MKTVNVGLNKYLSPAYLPCQRLVSVGRASSIESPLTAAGRQDGEGLWKTPLQGKTVHV